MSDRPFCMEHFSPRRDGENPPICENAYAKGLYPCEFPPAVSAVVETPDHTTCPKVPHTGTGYLHAADDDTLFDVDGVFYCGRCHAAVPRPAVVETPAEAPTHPGVAEVETFMRSARALTDPEPATGYGVRACRHGHWHVTHCDEDLVIGAVSEFSLDQALDLADKLNRGEDPVAGPRVPEGGGAEPVAIRQAEAVLDRYRCGSTVTDSLAALTIKALVQHCETQDAERSRLRAEIDARSEPTPSSYALLAEAIQQNLAVCICEDDVAEEAIYVDAIETAGVALSEADDALHTIRTQASRDLARKGNNTLSLIVTLIDAIWEDSVPFHRLREARRAPIREAGDTTETNA